MLLRPLLGAPSPSNMLASSLLLISALGALPVRAVDVLKTNGFSTCLDTDKLVVNRMNVAYDRGSNKVTFDVAGTSTEVQQVRAVLTVEVYGKEYYRKEFDPCDENIAQLCPVPQGIFAANDELTIPPEFAGQVPDIAFKIPDLDGVAKLKLLEKDSGEELACLSSVVDNGKTMNVPEVKYVTGAMAAAALVLSGLSALSAAGAGTAAPSPTFTEVVFWFQGIAFDGMLSVNYPKVYRSFSDNFVWSTGVFAIGNMQKTIDQFRKSTGGDLSKWSVEVLDNSTLIYGKTDPDFVEKSTGTAAKMIRRWAEMGEIYERQDVAVPNVSINGTTLDGSTADAPTSPETQSSEMRFVEGIQAKVETLKIPSANTFMTVLLIFCIVLAGVAVCILLFKVILELWALMASFPKALSGFRKRYWGFLMSTIVRIILILYGTWTLYCLYQFTNGDSWGAHVLAGATLAVFTGILGFFAFRIFSVARQVRKSAHGQEELFLHKPYLRKYGLFYDQFKSSFWWVFFPLIIYAFAKGAFIALGDGHGLVQTIGQLSCEVVLLVLLLWNRPYNTKTGNVLNTIISCVRVLSVVCLIVFVDQMGIAADTKTVTGVALIVIQSVLTAVLAICLIINAIRVMFMENPHTKKRKELEQLEKQREHDLTPLDARNSMLGGPYLGRDGRGAYTPAPAHTSEYPLHHMTPAPEHPSVHYRSESAASRAGLIGSAAPMPGGHTRQQSIVYEDYRNAAASPGPYHQQQQPPPRAY